MVRDPDRDVVHFEYDFATVAAARDTFVAVSEVLGDRRDQVLRAWIHGTDYTHLFAPRSKVPRLPPITRGRDQDQDKDQDKDKDKDKDKDQGKGKGRGGGPSAAKRVRAF